MADSVAEIFDRSLLKKRKERAGRRKAEYAPLLASIADGLAERIAEIKRTFPLGICLGAHGEAGATLHNQVGKLIDCALSQTLLGAKGGIVLDEEHLPFAEKSLDIIISFLTLHHINQVPKLLVQARKALHPDGVLLGVQIGAGSLDELRQTLAQAEEQTTGNWTARIAPMAEIRDMGDILQAAGFAMPVIDRQKIQITYNDPMHLLRDINGLGESNIIKQQTPLRRKVLERAMALYKENHSTAQGKVSATLELHYFMGWAPHKDQPKPLPRGSAKMGLEEALEKIRKSDMSQ